MCVEWMCVVCICYKTRHFWVWLMVKQLWKHRIEALALRLIVKLRSDCSFGALFFGRQNKYFLCFTGSRLAPEVAYLKRIKTTTCSQKYYFRRAKATSRYFFRRCVMIVPTEWRPLFGRQNKYFLRFTDSRRGFLETPRKLPAESTPRPNVLFLSSGMPQGAQTTVCVVSEDALTLKVLFLSNGNS